MDVLQKWFQGPTKGSDNPKKLEGKVAIVTGATSGIGKEVAKDLAGRGARVLILCRDQQRAQEVASEINGDVRVYQMDLSSMESVKQCALEVLQKEDKLDLLVNNAGVMMCPYVKTVDGFEKQFATNHLGHFLLTELLTPLLQKSATASSRSRIVITSSVAHKYGRMRWQDLNWSQNYNSGEAYAQSKLANVLHAKALARKLNDSHVSVYSVHPGVVVTDLFRHWMDYAFIRCMMPFAKPFMKTPWHGAQTTLYCLLEDSIEKESGQYYEDCHKVNSSASSRNEEDQDRLWKMSFDMIGKEYFE